MSVLLTKVPNVIIISSIFIFCSCSENNKINLKKNNNLPKNLEQETIPKKFDDEDIPNYQIKNLKNKKQLLQELFNSKNFDRHGNVKWDYPDYSNLNIPCSYDLKIHTGIDTIMYFKDQREDSCAVVILANYKIHYRNNEEFAFDSHGSGLTLGVALYYKVNDGWELYKFNKHLTELGEWGTYKKGIANDGEIYLKKLAENWTCLSFKQGLIGNTGVFNANETFYSIEREAPESRAKENEYDENFEEINSFEYEILSKLFSYDYENSKYIPDLEKETVIERNATLTMIPSKNSLYDFIVHVQIRKYDFNSKKLIYSKKIKQKFHYSTKLNIYLEK